MRENAKTRWVRNFRNRSPMIILSLVVISLLLNLWMSFQGNSVLALLKEVVVDKNRSRVYLATGMDAFLAKAAPDGNIVLRFKGFAHAGKEADNAGPLLIYFRSVYRLYPRKVFAVPPGVVVNTPEELADNPFDPSLEWMRSNGVRKRITMIKDGHGNIYTQIKNIPPKGNLIMGNKCNHD